MPKASEFSRGRYWQLLGKKAYDSAVSYVRSTITNFDAVEILVEATRGYRGLAIPMNRGTARGQRDAFLAELNAHVSTIGDDSIARLHEKIKTIECVYDELSSRMADAHALNSNDPAPILRHVGVACKDVEHRMKAHVESIRGGGIPDPHNLKILDDEGNEFLPDVVNMILSDTACANLIQIGYRHGCFNGKGQLEISTYFEQQEQRPIAEFEAMLAATWHGFQSAEVLCRAFDLPIVEEVSDGVTRVRCEKQHMWIRHDYIANRRVGRRLLQNYYEASQRIEDGFEIGSLSDRVSLPPLGWISVEEVFSASQFGEVFSVEISTDREFGGLRLSEWLRGYEALKWIARRRVRKFCIDKEADVLRIGKVTIESILLRGGMRPQSARLFIEKVTFNKHSEDLFDEPLIRLKDGSYLLVAPLFSSMDSFRTIMSKLAREQIKIESDGGAFEHRVIEKFRSNGVAAAELSFFDDDGEEFQLDCVVAWGDYLFLFECKSRYLSNGNSLAIFYDYLDALDHVEQVKRTAHGVENNRKLVSQRLGVDIGGKKVVPIVLNALPFSLPTTLQGVYFYDYSSLARFFESPTIDAKMMGKSGAKTVASVVRIWKGVKPTETDFLCQLNDSVQLHFENMKTIYRYSAIQISSQMILENGLYDVESWNIDEMTRQST